MRVALLTGRHTGRVRAALEQDLVSGDIQVAIGTHALFQEGVAFQRLGRGRRGRAASLRRAPAAAAAGEGPRRRPLSAPDRDDGHADPPHARDDGLRGPRRVGDRRIAAGPHADQDRGAAGQPARRSRRAHRHRLPLGPPGVLGLPADRGVRRAALPGSRGDGRGAGGGVARRAHRPRARPHAGPQEGRRHGRLQGRASSTCSSPRR